MAAIQPEFKDQQPASGLTLNLSSNNPFRNRAVSPASLNSPVSPFDDPVPPPRPVSRNPFLDPAINSRSSTQNIRAASESMSGQDKRSASPTAEDIFGALTLDDKTSPQPLINLGPDAAGPPANRRGPPPTNNMPPPGRRGPPPNHRPTRSQEEALRARRRQNGESSAAGPSDPSRSPQRRDRRRRNSESSVADDKALTEEEKKARDARRRERERRHLESKAKKPVNRKLDIIDQLDATSIYGTGMFHHDGPFDALNPHRNKSNSRRLAPMQAFPKDSLNNVIGGSGPLNARPDHAAIMGHHDEEAFRDWSTGAADKPSKTDVPVFDPLSRGAVLHGDESLGLGTSTFLEGTPAARTVIQQREQERAEQMAQEGLQRKKSLAQRIRNINRGPRDYPPPSGRLTNPEGAYMSRRTPSDGGPERNPFFSEYGKNGEENISVRRPSNGDSMSPTSPRGGMGLERRATADGIEDKPSGIIGRMKSLKGGRRTRPAPPNGDNNGMAAPGTAV
ncbi:Pal1 cell morphology protein-domain-containing protein [Rhypophila decipiens]|uniref:Pal1 cell morphology protein-domain-containing protein n=1 Tax=Rhypophila decipiens TaxID=261697 RepID=A0AAN6Y329_9PEZI|nr:Pal1 cell morphology protein-domain-containing protein [Rhypophila decipiens]